jgi:hypothetical protein
MSHLTKFCDTVTFAYLDCGLGYDTVKIEIMDSSEMSVITYNTVECHNQEDDNLNFHPRGGTSDPM